jgi:hypothetical protein
VQIRIALSVSLAHKRTLLALPVVFTVQCKS